VSAVIQRVRESADSPLDVLPARRPSPWPAALLAAVLHLAAVGVALRVVALPQAPRAESAQQITRMVEIEAPEPEPPPPAPPVTPPEPAPPPLARARVREPVRAQPPPAAAAAGQVLARDTPEVLDFGDSFVQGNAERHAGGVTQSSGTSQAAVRAHDARGAGVNRTRPPALADGVDWDCPFPEEADSAEIDSAVVGLQVVVNAAGEVQSATVTRDPGHGFAREARRCALSKRWRAGLDHAGDPTDATSLVNVRFERRY
jgi:periplasmic protein TonB